MSIIKKIIKTILSLLLVMNNVLFAAIISDNDGSAFVTKSEFDALKNSFNEQIDRYNSSLDNKVDGAIAQYLNGMKLATVFDLDNYVEKLTTDYNLRWNNSSTGYLTTKPYYKSILTVRMFAFALDSSTWANSKTYSGMNTQTISNTPFLKMPICNTDSSGNVTINYYEERQTEITMDGYWCFPRVSQSVLTSGTGSIKFGTAGFAQMFQTGGVNPCKGKTTFAPYIWNGYNGMVTNSDWASSGWCTMLLSGTCNVLNQNLDSKYILINTNSSASTYYFNLDNATDGKLTSYAVDSGTAQLKFDNTNWQTMTGGSTSGTHFSGASSVSTSQPMTPKYTNASLPWSQNYMISQNMYDARINTVTGKKKPLKNGVCMFDVEKSGVVTFSIKVSGAGSVRVYAYKGSNESSILYDNTQTYTANETKNYSINVEPFNVSPTDKVQFWVKYTPSGTSNVDRKLEVIDARVVATD